ncbi:hypothetical protein [Pseudomonas sp. Irchel s3f7]|uniref:hypothetical protein n=1 Tax=Pseudomonas sp. Irchel s3f7 TaxID=2009153 RepID=UPI00117B99A5|nr:hypothetical protein [Pseudomonas sp. Irchel s3f7]
MTALMKEIGIAEKEDAISKGVIVLFFFILGVSVSAFAIWFLAPHDIASMPVDQMLVHDRTGKPYELVPEPLERAIFVVIAALAPAALVGYFWIADLGGVRSRRARTIPTPVKIGLPIFAAVIFVATFVFSDFIDILFFSTVWAKSYKSVLLIFGLLTSFGVVFHSQLYKKTSTHAATISWWLIICVAIALQILPNRIASISSVTLSTVWSVHLDAVIYALNQVVHGKTIILDLPSQYGFYPEIIAPIFKIFGLSVLSVTLFFATLHAIGLVAVAAMLKKYVHNSLLALLIFLTMLIPMSLFMYLNGSVEDIYVQYFPIRFFWPAVALLLFSSQMSKPGRLKFSVLGAVAGISVFWNIDTGIPVLVSIGATLLVKPLIAKRSALRGIVSAALFGAIAISTIVACFVALRIKAGVPLDLGEVLAYQKIFYMAGFGMIPMPVALDPWQAVLVIYAAGAITALSRWKEYPESSVYDVLFCGAIMGLGLFTYYQGRSHVYCLVLVCWPAIFIAGILADKILSAVRHRSTQLASVALALPIVLFVSLGTITFLSSGKELAGAALRNISTLGDAKDPTVVDELRFMRETYRNRDCLILSQRQAIYYAELNIASPLKGPGIVETLLQRDLDQLVEGALNEQLECIYLGVTDGSITFVDVNDSALKAKYPVISKSPLGTMLLLEPAPTAGLQK